MSNRYKGGIISATPPTTTGGESGTASGAWTLEQQMQAQAAGLWPLQPTGPYVEDVFSTWLYTGNGATQTITNGIDLAGKGGLVWQKARNTTWSNALFDTVRGVASRLVSDSTIAASNTTNGVTAFNSNGFSMGANAFSNNAGDTYVSWTFREQPKFFDVVTYTGNGAATQTLNHNLGSVPGVIILKPVSTTGAWLVYHRSIPNSFTRLNTNEAALNAGVNYWNPTSTTIDATSYYGNDVGVTYVAYLFAHDAGGFGLSGTDNVISCGSFTTDGSGNATVNLGYEAQFAILKPSSSTGGWLMYDNMRGWSLTSQNYLLANSSTSELSATTNGNPTATGFFASNLQPSVTYIYIAIRRGPMRTPTTGTSVFAPVAQNGGNGTGVVTTNFPVDFSLSRLRGFTGSFMAVDRLRGAQANGPMARLSTADTTAEASNLSNGFGFDNNTGYLDNWFSANPVIYENFRRAPSVFDVVCYTGTGSTRAINHNLGVAPELIIFKQRNSANAWYVYSSSLPTYYLVLNSDGPASDYQIVSATSATTFTVGGDSGTNNTGNTYVDYLFASCPGVSKVGSYTGTGTTQVINCGFTGGARFVMIKRTDFNGSWHVWDSARGIVAGNDPYLLLNSTAAEVTSTDFVDAAATGFELTSEAPAAINASGGTFIFLAIA